MNLSRRLLAFILLAPLAIQAQKGNDTLFIPKDFPKETSADFTYLLTSATGTNWHTAVAERDVNKGIILKIANRPELTSKESFSVRSNGSSLLTISSASIDGLIFGMYQHLRLLGFKFYLPGELYTIIPQLKHPFGDRLDRVGKPFLEIRNFAGTGGLGSTNPDPDKSVEKSWNLWKLRN